MNGQRSQTDAQGTVISQSDMGREVYRRYPGDQMAPFRTNHGPDIYDQAIQYTGHISDSWEHGPNFNSMRARYQEQATSRFLSRDTWTGRDSRPQSKNRYAYAEGNPASRVDPSGRHPRSGYRSMDEYGKADVSRQNADGTHPIIDRDGRDIVGAYYDPRHHAYVYQLRPDWLRARDPRVAAQAFGNNVIVCRDLCPYGSYLWWHEFAHLSQARAFPCVSHEACFDHNDLFKLAYVVEEIRAELEAIANGRPGQGYYYHRDERNAHGYACGKVPDAEECKQSWPPD